MSKPVYTQITSNMEQFLEERLRLALTGDVPGAQIDKLITTLATLFRQMRPAVTPAEILVAVSAPNVCGAPFCHCSDHDCELNSYNITIFVDRREQGRSITKPWVRASSTMGYEDAVSNLMGVVERLIKPAGGKEGEDDKEIKVKKEEEGDKSIEVKMEGEEEKEIEVKPESEVKQEVNVKQKGWGKEEEEVEREWIGPERLLRRNNSAT